MIRQQSLLTRENSLILRGIAIVFIVLHNFLHISQMGFSPENEMSFSIENVRLFYDTLYIGNENLVWEFFSHLGWIGVPVFVFLTGYGISIKNPLATMKESFFFVKKSYNKLLALMLPAVLFYIAMDFLKEVGGTELWKRISYLTMLTNIGYPYLKCNPGVYWYFGLTFQFYLLWALLGRRMNVKNLLVWSAVLLLLLYVFCSYCSPNALSIFRHCFTGWFPVFAIGVIMGICKKDDYLLFSKSFFWAELILWVAFLGLILLMSRWLAAWLFVPIISLIWFFVMGMLLLRTRYLSEVFRWIGKYSACIFVCHPIARTIVINTLHRYSSNLVLNLSVYILLTMLIALVYNYVYHWLLTKMKPKSVCFLKNVN